MLPQVAPHPPSFHWPLVTAPLTPQVHVDQELLIYEAFPHDSQISQGNLKVRFKKVPHNINFREKKLKLSKKKAEGSNTEEGAGTRGRVARFRYFEDIYGYSGVGSRGLGWGKVRGLVALQCLSPGLHLRPFAPLAPGDQQGGPAATPHGH